MPNQKARLFAVTKTNIPIMKLLLSLFLFITASITFAQVQPQANAEGGLIFKGTIPTKGKTADDLKECVADFAEFMDIESTENNRITGTYSYTYAVDAVELWAGEITFRFDFTFNSNAIVYNFYDFDHKTGESKFKPAGILPLNWNAKVGDVFTQARFNEIKGDIKTNMALIVKTITNECAK